MKICQAAFGVSHFFELARQLHSHGHLNRIYSTWPRARLRREGLPPNLVETFPWLGTVEYALNRYDVDLPWLSDQLGYANALAFDRWTEQRIPRCDAFVAMSGAGLRTGRLVQDRGGLFICDRGSTHQVYQERIVAEEFLRWGVHSRSNADPRDVAREEAIYSQADIVTVPSNFAAKSFIVQGVPSDKVRIVPLGIDRPGNDLLDPLSISLSDDFEALYVGYVSLRKGFPYLLQAFSRLPFARKRLRVVGGISPEMKRLLPHLPTDRVDFVGHLPRAKVLAAMQSSHVLVLPSIEDGFGLVVSEGLGCGCPVIVSENTGAADLVTDGRNGFVIPIRDADALCDCMERLADGATNVLFREAARRSAEQLGGWREYGERWESLLRNALTGRLIKSPV